MADRYLRWTGSGPGRFLSRRLGLPRPVPLRRRAEGDTESARGPLLHLAPAPPAAVPSGAAEWADVLAGIGQPVHTAAPRPPASGRPDAPYAAVVVDATGVATVADLRAVHRGLHPVVRAVAECGRFVVLGTRPDPADHHQAAAQQALEGFTRSLGKEVGGGRTAQLVRLAPGATARDAESTLRFLLSPRSAYVSGQVIEVGAAGGTDVPAASAAAPEGPGPLAGRTALVTGCARGIGESVASTLARDGAHVLCLDVPQAGDDLGRVAERLGGTALPLDITADDAGAALERALPPGGLDVLVHNAGITRDRRLANMSADRWDAVLDTNLDSVLRTTDHLLRAEALPPGSGRVVATASVAGIAGNVGQTNYAAAKAGIIGLVRSLAPRAAAEHGVTVNAVAPGFIETRMTAAVPFLVREAGRRMNSLGQGGLPVDVAEATAWLAAPGSAAVNGQVIRVCGQSLLGA